MDTEPNTSYRRDLLLLFIGTLLFFCIGLGLRPYVAPSEARYIEIPRQMLATGDWLTPHIDGVPYFEKPPLFYWIQAVFMGVLGQGEFAGRLATALMMSATCLVTYATGRVLYNRLSGLLGAGILATSFMGYGLSRVAALDVPVSLFITCAIACFIGAQSPSPALPRHAGEGAMDRPLSTQWGGTGRGYFYLLMYVFSALAVMTKGLIGIAIPGIVIGAWIALSKRWRILVEARLIAGTLLFLAIAAPWHILMAHKHPDFLNFYIIHEHFTRYMTDEHKRIAPWWFFIAITMGGLLPWTGLTWGALRRLSWADDKDRFMLLWVALPFIFFSASHSKLIPYIFPIFPPLCMLLGHKLALIVKGELPDKSLRIDAWVAITVFATLLAGFNALPAMSGKIAQAAANVTGMIDPLSLLPLMIALVLLGLVSVIGRPREIVIAMAGLSIVTGISANTIAATLDTTSIKPLALLLNKQIKPEDSVVAYDSYWQDLPVYLNRDVLIAGWTGELSFGYEHYPDSHKIMISDEEFWQRCSASLSHIYVFLREDTANNLPNSEGCQLKIVGQHGKTVLMEKTLP